ncbi:Alcohol dehydrogenase zinc-binding domain protein [Candida maltosa Xu316]|uniref:Alcohol dehydrogenase zinc-binding domain protein n=1 Tax=Candida maltosa (strain Xu316) TaxID=1245528 RepID=M3JU17_CANMX|nr:Alcohol dehydrogenase zinc-binding domain protein [Candida maltosa Xu316]
MSRADIVYFITVHVPAQEKNKVGRKIAASFNEDAKLPNPKLNDKKLKWGCNCSGSFWNSFRLYMPEKLRIIVQK